MKRVVVHIDRLVLRGFDGDDRSGIAEGLRAELGRLLAGVDLPHDLIGLGGKAPLKVDAVRLEHGSVPMSVGQRLARGIARGVRK
jgi:hypothetical protein